MRRALAFLFAVSVLAVPAAPAGAQGTPSCVGQFASTFAREDGAAFGADISFGAQFAWQPNFGAGVMAPFAHEPRDACFYGDRRCGESRPGEAIASFGLRDMRLPDVQTLTNSSSR
jgi:hypothetical protein